MKNLKKRIEKLEDEVLPQRFMKLEIISHIPCWPSRTILIPVKKRKR